jgi:phosphotriesterase-related protein
MTDTMTGASTVVQTVTGPIASDEMGITLPHDHVIADFTAWFDSNSTRGMIDREVGPEIIGDLRHDPFGCKHNLVLDDEELAVREVSRFKSAGGGTILDPTCIGVGRDVLAQQRVSKQTHVNIVAGTGYYVRHGRPPEVEGMSAEQVAEIIVRDVVEGIDGTGIRSGFIGEIGITDNSAAITEQDEKVLRGAARAHAETKVPLSIHLCDPLGDRVLDIVEEEGGSLEGTILCHMNHTQDDLEYQIRLAERGVRLAYDNIGIDWYYPGTDYQTPCDHEQAQAVLALIEAGYADRLLLSSDVFIKMQLMRYGGFGYAHVLRNFLPRLRRVGVEESAIEMMMVENPRKLFENAARA